MRTFPSVLASYVDKNRIKMTTMDKFKIYACFINVASISEGYDFEHFAFCPGDKALLRVLQNMMTLRFTDISKQKLLSTSQFCNPNAQVPTITTIIGKFYGVSACDPKGMTCDKYCVVIFRQKAILTALFPIISHMFPGKLKNIVKMNESLKKLQHISCGNARTLEGIPQTIFITTYITFYTHTIFS